jgi:hypothetical protein
VDAVRGRCRIGRAELGERSVEVSFLVELDAAVETRATFIDAACLLLCLRRPGRDREHARRREHQAERRATDAGDDCFHGA